MILRRRLEAQKEAALLEEQFARSKERRKSLKVSAPPPDLDDSYEPEHENPPPRERRMSFGDKVRSQFNTFVPLPPVLFLPTNPILASSTPPLPAP